MPTDNASLVKSNYPEYASPKIFKSTEQTGTGAEQSIPHGLGVVPSVVIVVPTKVNAVADTWVEGAHDATNAKATVTTGAKYIVIAIA